MIHIAHINSFSECYYEGFRQFFRNNTSMHLASVHILLYCSLVVIRICIVESNIVTVMIYTKIRKKIFPGNLPWKDTILYHKVQERILSIRLSRLKIA